MSASTDRWKTFLHGASRSRRFLWKLALGFIALGVLAGMLTHRFQPAGPANLADRVIASLPTAEDAQWDTDPRDLHTSFFRAFNDAVMDPAVQFAHLADALPRLAPLLVFDDAATTAILRKKFSPEEVSLAADFIAMHATDAEKAKSAAARLRAAAAREKPPRFANHLLGVHEAAQGNHTAASGHFLAEGVHPDARTSRLGAIHSLISAKNFDELSRLSRDPLYGSLITASDRLEMAVSKRDWGKILRDVPLAQIDRQSAGLLMLTAITGLAWAFFLFHLGEAPRLLSSTTLLCALGFILGAISTTPTILATIWQDDFLHLSEGDNLVQILAYNVGGIGLREELCKLILFLPLVPVLLRRGDEREALLVASFVGLGFATEENGGYFLSSHGVDAPGRYLTANFLHIALTGMNGLALFRAIGWGGRGINEFLTTLPLTVLVHGLYNGLGRVPELEGIGGYLSITLYVLFSLMYLRHADALRDNARMTIGLTGAFIFGLSIVAAAVIFEQVAALGPTLGLIRIFPELTGVGILVLMFVRTFNEGLSE